MVRDTASSDDADLVTIGELARQTNLAPSTLRYYEELGLLTPYTRISGRRCYRQHAVEDVGLICFLHDVGFTLSEIGELLGGEQGDSETRRALAERKKTELDDLIAKATAARESLDHALRCRHSDIGACATFWRIVGHYQAGEPLARAHVLGHTSARNS